MSQQTRFFKYLIYYQQSNKTHLYNSVVSLFLLNKKPMGWRYEAEIVKNKILFMVDIHFNNIWITRIRKQHTDRWLSQITAGPEKLRQAQK